MKIRIQISPGELIDRLTILELKSAALTDAAKLHNVHHELALLRRVRRREVPASEAVSALEQQLKAINQELWQVEDDIREREAAGDFGEAFIRLARAGYYSNDRRCELKRKINVLLDSEIVEEKGYKPYRAAAAGASIRPQVELVDSR